VWFVVLPSLIVLIHEHTGEYEQNRHRGASNPPEDELQVPSAVFEVEVD
jgi:hypothetical protein